jgi:hypothetical protein
MDFQLLTQPVAGSMDINASVSQVNSAIEAPKAAEIVAYAHATLFLPALNTLQKALSGINLQFSWFDCQDITTPSASDHCYCQRTP